VSIALLALTDLAWRRGYRSPSLLALAAICGLGFWSDHRGLAGIAALTAVFVLLPLRHRHRHPRIFLTAGSIALLLGALSILFVDSAQAGFLGKRSASQVREYGSNPVSILGAPGRVLLTCNGQGSNQGSAGLVGCRTATS
jgi:hypothetical protein